jgi:hypothetical protein
MLLVDRPARLVGRLDRQLDDGLRLAQGRRQQRGTWATISFAIHLMRNAAQRARFYVTMDEAEVRYGNDVRVPIRRTTPDQLVGFERAGDGANTTHGSLLGDGAEPQRMRVW